MAHREFAVQIRVVPGSSAAIYRQIADQIRRGIASGELSVGDAVPSVRALAKELVVNPNTVAKAARRLFQTRTAATARSSIGAGDQHLDRAEF